MPELEDLKKHPLFIDVLANIRPILTDVKERPSDPKKREEWQKSAIAKRTPIDTYKVNVFHRVANLSYVLDRLHMARRLLYRAPFSSQTQTALISRNDWTDYHYFVYTTALASALDCCLHITVEICRLGISVRHSTFDVVTEHRNLVGTPIATALKAIRKVLLKETERRHRYLHRGEESSFADLVDREDFLNLRAITFVTHLGEMDVPPKLVSTLWKFKLHEIKPKLKSVESNLAQTISKLFDQLSFVYGNVAQTKNR